MRMRSALAFAMGCMLAAAPAVAHHGPSSLGTVRFSQPVQVGGMTLQPGTYEVRLTGEHVAPLPGQSDEGEQRVEFVSAGQVVAKEVATVVPVATASVVGTSGSQSVGRVQMLKGNEFMRVSFNKGNERFLIHLATGYKLRASS